MNRTLQNMLAKCVDDDQRKWSTKLPYVMMAYRSSVHESTCFSPQFFVHGRELALPIDVMYPNNNQGPPMTPEVFVYNRMKAFQRAFELVCAHFNHNQKRRNALYSQKVMDPHMRQIKKSCCITQRSLSAKHQSLHLRGAGPTSF